MQYCSLQHWILLPSPVTCTTGCFCFGSISSFFRELFLHFSPVAYWAPTDLGSSSFSVLSFRLFILFMGFSRQAYWSGFLFPPQWTTFCQTSPPWPAHLEWPHSAWLSFTELVKAVVHVIRLASFEHGVAPLSPHTDRQIQSIVVFIAPELIYCNVILCICRDLYFGGIEVTTGW